MVQGVVVMPLQQLILVDLVVEELHLIQVLLVIHPQQTHLKVIMVEMVQVQVDMLEVVAVVLLLTEVMQGQTIMVLMEEMEVQEHLIQF